MKAFWFYGRFSEAMSFSRFALLYQKSKFTYWKLSIVWLPRAKCLLLLCKTREVQENKASMNKEKHSLRNFAALESGGATQRNSSLPQTGLLIQKVQILIMTLPQKNGSRIKTPSSKLTILVSFCWEKNFIRNNAHNLFILSLVFLKIIDRNCCILSGPPCITSTFFFANWTQVFDYWDVTKPHSLK